MHLDFTDEQLELRDAARSALARECPPRLVAAVAGGGPGQDELTAALTWLGWPALAVDVDLGGLGRSFVELGILNELRIVRSAEMTSMTNAMSCSDCRSTHSCATVGYGALTIVAPW